MRCPSCGFENPEGMKFCGQCASPLGRRCPQCGFDNPQGFAFCGQCAAPLTTAPSMDASSPQKYTPGHLIEKILTSKTAFEGERKQVTVLFADLKGSTEITCGLDPESAQRVLNPALHCPVDGHHVSGCVAKTYGSVRKGWRALVRQPVRIAG
jgi:Double zinc ribbon